jgi:hypothetical protein
MIGEARGSSSPRAAHLLRHLEPGHAVAHERLVHVEVEEADLGVGDLRERLPVDARELQQRDQRQAGRQHGGDVAQQLQVVLGQRLERGRAEAHRRVQPLDQRGLEPGLAGGVLDRVVAVGRLQEVLDRPEGQPALPGGLRDLAQRVPAPRSRATRRAWPSAASSQPSAARGTTPASAQRRSVPGDTPTRRAASAVDSGGVTRRLQTNRRRDPDVGDPAARGNDVPLRRPVALVAWTAAPRRSARPRGRAPH